MAEVERHRGISIWHRPERQNHRPEARNLTCSTLPESPVSWAFSRVDFLPMRGFKIADESTY
jgi:hypothetical protein